MISKPLPRFRRSKALCPFLADQTLTVISYLSSGYTLKCIVLFFSEFLSTLPRPALDSCVSCSCGWSWNLQGCISVRLSNRYGLGIFRVAFLFVCQIAALVFTSGPAGQVPFFVHLLGRRNSDIISSVFLSVNNFFISFFCFRRIKCCDCDPMSLNCPALSAVIRIITSVFFKSNRKSDQFSSSELSVFTRVFGHF